MNNVISPFWETSALVCAAVTGTTYGIFTSTTGVSPNRIFNIEWRAAYYNSGGAGYRLTSRYGLYERQVGLISSTAHDGTGSSPRLSATETRGQLYAQFSCNTASLSDGMKYPGCPDLRDPFTHTDSYGYGHGFTDTYRYSTANNSTNATPACTNYSSPSGCSIGSRDGRYRNHVDDGGTVIALPFSYTLYDQSFTTANVGANGHVTFGTAYNGFGLTCLPEASATTRSVLYGRINAPDPWQRRHRAVGIFTSTSGVGAQPHLQHRVPPPPITTPTPCSTTRVRLFFEGQLASM